jgi:hypothetical protein
MKVQLPIDTSAVSFIDVMLPEPMPDHQTKQKGDANGEPPYSNELLDFASQGQRPERQVSPHSPVEFRGMPAKMTD